MAAISEAPARPSLLGILWRRKTALIGLGILTLVFLAALLADWISPHDPLAMRISNRLKPPSMNNWFGTDEFGRDIFARVMDGGRISLLVAITSTVISAIIGFLVGAVSALAGRWADAVTMRFVDLVMTLPPVIFLLVLASIAGTGIWPTVLVISLLSWPLLARMVRSRLLELRERDFVMAARGMGAGLPHLLLRHGLPNSIDILVVFATLQIANAILLEAGLSFLGLGIAPPAASWGNMLNAARSTAVLEQYPWQWLFPGGALVLAVLAINFIGDGLRDAFDPRAELN